MSPDDECRIKMLNGKRCAQVAPLSLAKFKLFLHNRGAVCTPCVRTVDWVVVGGESGPGVRPMHPNSARSLRNQCQGADVPFFLKQRGEWLDADEWSASPDGKLWN